MRKALIVGIALGLLSTFMSLTVAGGGHGWNSAWPFGLMSIVLFPTAFALYANAGPRLALVILAVLALSLDIALAATTALEGIHYVYAVWPLAITWTVLWLSWQAMVLVALTRRHRVGA